MAAVIELLSFSLKELFLGMRLRGLGLLARGTSVFA